MKKLPNHETEIEPSLGMPPKHLVVKRITAQELGPEFFRESTKPLVFKETTHEDFDRIRAELKNELGKV